MIVVGYPDGPEMSDIAGIPRTLFVRLGYVVNVGACPLSGLCWTIPKRDSSGKASGVAEVH
jgi:hypothetical protein